MGPWRSCVDRGSARRAAVVDRTGAVAHIWVLREPRITPPFPPLNQAILDALQQWKYEPFLKKGEPVPICITVTVNIDWQ
jgi:hypothetical protein